MQFYEDVIKSAPAAAGDLPLNAHFHAWTPDSVARLWSIWANNPLLRTQFYPRRYYESLLDDARPHLGEVGVVADIGCGSGTVMSVLRDRRIGRRRIGIDLSEESIARLRQVFDSDPAYEFRVGSISRTGLDSESCDLAICTETLEHLFPADFETGLDEIARVLKPHGRFLATVPLEERPAFVVCPECHAIFAPFQHMLFNFTIAGLGEALKRRDLEIVHLVHPIDTAQPRAAWKRVVKDRIMRPLLPGLTRRLFRVAGVSGFVARKRGDA
jgi:ubiquinone/menaquinone biosynthesis C-methylase UbiE